MIAMKRSHDTFCFECDEEIVPVVTEGPAGTEPYLDLPDECPHCGEPTDGGGDPDVREDFHADV
jgi:hypothetical protein